VFHITKSALGLVQLGGKQTKGYLESPLSSLRGWAAAHGHFVWVLAILIAAVFVKFQPMPLLRRAAPFDDPDWIFELKYDGFRALTVVENGRAQLLSRNGHPFASFAELGSLIATSLPNVQRAVLDGEIVCVDDSGRPQFRDLLFRRGDPCFFAFDLLVCDSRNLRSKRLIDRKQELRRLLRTTPVPFPLRYADHVENSGTALFQRVCDLDLEGIIAKHKSGPYVTERENSTWFKIRNRGYSQMQGREELFERERHKESVPGWHSCNLACAKSES